jgi:hypothetical protein
VDLMAAAAADPLAAAAAETVVVADPAVGQDQAAGALTAASITFDDADGVTGIAAWTGTGSCPVAARAEVGIGSAAAGRGPANVTSVEASTTAATIVDSRRGRRGVRTERKVMRARIEPAP